MQLLNDRPTEGPETREETGILPVVAHSLLTAVGVSTAFFAPLPMILAHQRLAQPWPKVVALAGAVVSLVLLKAPVLTVAAAFVFGLFVADSLSRAKSFWSLAGQAVPMAGFFALGALFVASEQSGLGMWAHWGQWVDRMLGEFRQAMDAPAQVQWEALRAILLYEGPFLYLSGVILSAWICVGAAAHFGWTPEGSAFSAQELRKLRLPGWFCAGAVVLFAVVAVRTEPGLAGGLLRLVGSILFVQGCVCLSEVLQLRSVAPRMRSLIYALAIPLGFYALVGMGAISPWFFRRQERLKARWHQLNRRLEEGI